MEPWKGINGLVRYLFQSIQAALNPLEGTERVAERREEELVARQEEGRGRKRKSRGRA